MNAIIAITANKTRAPRIIPAIAPADNPLRSLRSTY